MISQTVRLCTLQGSNFCVIRVSVDLSKTQFEYSEPPFFVLYLL
jgi:hypothetical protein